MYVSMETSFWLRLSSVKDKAHHVMQDVYKCLATHVYRGKYGCK